MNAPRALVVGDLLYDLISETKGPLALGTDTFAPIRAGAGGSGANVAVWLARLGVDAFFVGRVGEDVFGRSLAEELEREGVKTRLARDASRPTGKVVVLVDASGERTMITDRGASEALIPEDLPAEPFRAGGHLHLPGYAFSEGSRRETALEALRRARDAGMTTSVDPSAVSLLEAVGPGRFLESTRGADLFFPNLEEGSLLAGAGDPEAVIGELRGHYGGVVLKLGAGGAAYAGTDGEIARLPARSARVVDTTGAGDALCAAFLAAWLAGVPPEGALRRGVELAAWVTERVGARPKL